MLSCVERGLGCGAEGELRVALLSLKAGVLLGREQYGKSVALAAEALDGLPAGGRRWYMTFVTLYAASALSEPRAVMNLARRFLDVLPSPEARDEYLRAGVWLQWMLAIVGEKGVAHELLLRIRREGVHISKGDASAWAYLRGAEACHHNLLEHAIWSAIRALEDAIRNLSQTGRWGDRCLLTAFYRKALTDLGDHVGAMSVLRANLVLKQALLRHQDCIY
jgi:hypothetical protein